MRFFSLFQGWLKRTENRAGRRASRIRENRRRRLELEQLEDRTVPTVSVGTNFAGMASIPSGYYPPDTNAAVGPNSVIEVDNQVVTIYDKTGKQLSSESLPSFFNANASTTDPVVVYDDQANRFVITDDEVDSSTHTNHLLIAVSNTSTPTNLATDFTEKQAIDVTESSGGMPLWGDQPQLGWNADAYVVSLNMYQYPYGDSSSFDHVQLLAIQKSSLLDQNPNTLTDYRSDLSSPHFSVAPARMHGSVSGDPMWLAEIDSNASGDLVEKMTNVLSPNPSFVITDVATNSGSTPYAPNSSPQPGGGNLDAGDAQIRSSPDWRNGMLVTAQGLSYGSDLESKVHWAEFNTSGSAPSLVQSGTVDPGSGVWAYDPSIAIDSNGDLGMTYLQSSASQYLSMYATGRASSDPTGTMETPVLVKAGQATYTDGASPHRTGDYSGISVDPSSPTMFWAANEYATTGSSPNWGTDIAEFSVAPSSYWTQANLSSYFNRVGIVNDGHTFTGGLDGNGHALSSNLAGASFPWQNTTVSLGPPGVNDVVSANGQTLSLPVGTYSTLTVFAAAVNGDQQNQSFTINYTNGYSETYTQSITNWLSVPGYPYEQRAQQMGYYDNANGTTTSQTVYDSGFFLPLRNDLQVKSITLPNDSNIEVLAMDLYHDATPSQQVNLSSYYNRVGIANDGQTFSGGGLDGNGHALSGNLAGGSFPWQNITVSLGTPGVNDVVSANGQSINLPVGIYSTVTIFVAAVNGDQLNQPFTVNYTNGYSQTFTQSLTNWTSIPGYTRQQRAQQMGYYDNADGSRTNQTVYDAGFTVFLRSDLQVKSITLPNDPNVEVLAMIYA